MRGRIIAQPSLQVGDRRRPNEVELEGIAAKLGHVTVRIDQPGKQSASTAVDHFALHARVVSRPEHADHLAVVADQ